MKQKILIRVAMTDDRTRAKALNTVVRFKGVIAMEIKGDHRNEIEVTGDEVDMISLTNTLRKKVAFAELVSASKVEPPKDDDKKKDEKKPEEKKPEPCPCCGEPCCEQPWPHGYGHGYGYGVPSSYSYHLCDPGYYIGEPVYNNESNCMIM